MKIVPIADLLGPLRHVIGVTVDNDFRLFLSIPCKMCMRAVAVAGRLTCGLGGGHPGQP